MYDDLFQDPTLFYKTELILRQMGIRTDMPGFALLRIATIAYCDLKPCTLEEILNVVSQKATCVMIRADGKDKRSQIVNTITEALPPVETDILDFVKEVYNRVSDCVTYV